MCDARSCPKELRDVTEFSNYFDIISIDIYRDLYGSGDCSCPNVPEKDFHRKVLERIKLNFYGYLNDHPDTVDKLYSA